MRLTTTLVALALALYPQPPSVSQPPVVSGVTVGVLIDVTVLDRSGRPVLDLGVDDFELSEDGARQQILTGTLVQQGVPRSRADSAAGAGDAKQPGALPSVQSQSSASVPPGNELPTVTAVLFDRLSAESRAAARTAALAYVSTLVSSRDVAGVFLADLDLKTIQPFTNNAADLRAAVDYVAAVQPANTKDAERLRGRHAPALDPNAPVTAGAESGSTGFVSAADREKRLKELGPVERQLAEMELRMEEGYRQLTAEYSGEASLAGLRAVVDGLGTLGGRKSILYFAETLDITSRLKPRFESLIGMANRSNVTLYTVDAAGLRVHSKDAEVARNVMVAGAQGTGDATRGDGPWTKELERQEQLVSSRPSAALGRLAKETGGFLLENTNNLGAGIPRIQQERTNYYLLGYQSTKALDGKFRRVSVKVKRSGVTVKARSGYLAVPARVP
jgi:VWFA-related protein